MQMPGRHTESESYRYAYNGMETDNEVSGNGNSYTTEFRQYDPRLGRWKSLDPLKRAFPHQSPYVAFDNNPIFYTDPSGLSAGPGDTTAALQEQHLSTLDPGLLTSGHEEIFSYQSNGKNVKVTYTYVNDEKWDVKIEREDRANWNTMGKRISYLSTPIKNDDHDGGNDVDDPPPPDPCAEVNCNAMTNRKAGWHWEEVHIEARFDPNYSTMTNADAIRAKMLKVAGYLRSNPGGRAEIYGNINGTAGFDLWSDDVYSRPAGFTKYHLAMERANALRTSLMNDYYVSGSQLTPYRGVMSTGAFSAKVKIWVPTAQFIYSQVELEVLKNCCGLEPKDLKVTEDGKPLSNHK